MYEGILGSAQNFLRYIAGDIFMDKALLLQKNLSIIYLY